MLQVLEPDVLPWPIATLGDGLLENVQPGFACGNHNSGGDGIVHVRPFNVTTDGRMDFSTVKSVPSSEVTKPERLLTQGDVVFNNTNSPELVGKTAFYGDSQERAFSNHMTRLRVNEDRLRPQYLALILHQLWREGYFVDKCNNHVSQASISRTVLLETEIALPPLDEQDRLVEAISATQGAADQARDRLATIPALLKKFRQSILAAAWQEAAEEGEIKDLVEVCESLTDGDHQPPPKSASGIPFITISALEGAVLNIGAAKRFVPNSYLESLDSKRKAKSGDVLYSVTGSIGVPALVETDEPFVFQRHIAILRPDLSEVSSKYMYYLLLSEQALNQGRDCATGIAQMTIPLRGLRKYQVPVPSHEMQSEIVCRVESLFALADSIESRLAEATAQVERTTQAILAKAFRGELLADEADDC